MTGLLRRLRKVGLVLTGEGRIDDSTFMGKGVGRLARLCREREIPCFGFAGSLGQGYQNKSQFSRVYGMTELTTSFEAMARPAVWLRALAAQAARNCQAL
jgi:glycerate kinase